MAEQAPEPQPELVPVLTLAPRDLPLARLRLDMFAGIAVDETAWDHGGVSFQGVENHATGEKLEILVRAHDDETLDGLLRDYDSWTVSPVQTTRVCGVAAQRVRATRRAEQIRCVIRPGGKNGPAYLPAAQVHALAFRHHGMGVVISVRVDSDEPQPHLATVERILSSVVCL